MYRLTETTPAASTVAASAIARRTSGSVHPAWAARRSHVLAWKSMFLRFTDHAAPLEARAGPEPRAFRTPSGAHLYEGSIATAFAGECLGVRPHSEYMHL